MSIRAIRKKNQNRVKETIFDVFSHPQNIFTLFPRFTPREYKKTKMKRVLQQNSECNQHKYCVCFLVSLWRGQWDEREQKSQVETSLHKKFVPCFSSSVISHPVSHCPCFGNWIQPKVIHIIHSMRWIKTPPPWETSPSSCLHLRWLTTHCKFAVLCNNSISATRWSSLRFDMRPNSRDCALSAHCRC